LNIDWFISAIGADEVKMLRNRKHLLRRFVWEFCVRSAGLRSKS
jgi:hypothetical protein